MTPYSSAGVLTFLFTDLEDSTRLWEQFPDAMRTSLAQHDQLLHTAVESHQGRVVKTTGDGLHAVFDSPSEALAAALAGQHALLNSDWPGETGRLQVRMGLHSGESQARDGDYYGSEVNRAARVMGLGSGGQILLSEITASLTRSQLPPACTLSDLGEHRLKGVAGLQRIFQLQHPALKHGFPELKSLATFNHNLPRQLSSFVGRERELQELARLLAGASLITVLGPGGTGKTRLILQAAEEVIEHYPDGVWLIELAPLTDPELIAERVAAALNVEEQPNRLLSDTLVDFLRRKELLLLLDNVEHMVQASAEFSEHLLRHCPKIKILVSGREALFIEGEAKLQLPSLSLPEVMAEGVDLAGLAACESVQLFLERARSVRPEFDLNANNAAALSEIVRRLDGIPLALELAASRLRMLTLEKIAERLGDRFRLLTGGRRTALPRQQTLEAAIDWSWQLLDDMERTLLRRLSVFSGGWSLEAAEEICGFGDLDEAGVFENLDQLINKSLVVVDHVPESEPRYRLLESIHQFARSYLFAAEEGQVLRDRHASYFVGFADRADSEFYKRGMMKLVRQLRQDLNNMRAVMEWTLEESPQLSLRLVGFLRHNMGLWMTPRESLSWLLEAIERNRSQFEGDASQVPAADFIRALIAAGFTSILIGEDASGTLLIEEAARLASDHGELQLYAYATAWIAPSSIFQLTPETILALEEAIQICREHGFQNELAMNLIVAGGAIFLRGDPESGEAYIEEALEIRQELGGARGLAMALDVRGGLAYYAGDLDLSLKLAGQAIEHYAELGAQQGLNMNRSRLAHTLRKLNRLAEARAMYVQTIRAWQEQGHLPAVAHQLECLAYMDIADGRFEQAARLIGAAKAARESLQVFSKDPKEVAELDAAMADLTQRLGEAQRDDLLGDGEKMNLDDAVLLALEPFTA
jgi:predicted ATPase/class 3 adenylate cyclase/tetratricopeptide (TPR) repeat protein